MQRILRVNLQTRNQAAKVARKKKLADLKKEWRTYELQKTRAEKELQEYIRTERKHRREDWMAGPLAPKRNVGTKDNTFGTVSVALVNGPKFPRHAVHGPKGSGSAPVGREGFASEHKEWEGLGNEGNIVEGDRVCVVRGKPSLVGQIGKVKQLSPGSKDLRIEGLNMADVEIPPGIEGSEGRSFQSTELPISIFDVRLVHRLTDETTGRDRDVIVKLLRGGDPYFQREPNSPIPRHTRYIAGEDIEIPWPEVDIPIDEAFDGDTRRYDVEQPTWTPTLFAPPLPNGIFDELYSDRYSKLRRWHQDEYVRMRVLEDARAMWYAERKIQSPLQRRREEILKVAAQRAEEITRAGMSEETRRLIQETRVARSFGGKVVDV